MNLIKNYIGLILLCSLVSPLVISTRAYGPGETLVSIVPPPIQIRENEDFTITVRIFNVEGLAAYSFEIMWDTSYLAFVSHNVTPPFPPPWIIPSPTLNETAGFIVIGAARATQPYYSGSSADLATVTFHALKSGSTTVLIRDLSLNCAPTIIVTQDAEISILDSATLVYVRGEVTSYGSEVASGLLSLFAAESSFANVSRGWCIFTVPPLSPRITIFPEPAFNFTIYAFRMINVSSIEFDHDSSALLITGYWEVGNVTNPRSISDILHIFANTVQTPGEFGVDTNWIHFSLNATGFDPVSGNVVSHCVRVIDTILGRLPIGDLNEDGKIDMRDLSVSCRAFGSTLGFDHYDLGADLNCDAIVDMKDISLLARHFGEILT